MGVVALTEFFKFGFEFVEATKAARDSVALLSLCGRQHATRYTPGFTATPPRRRRRLNHIARA